MPWNSCPFRKTHMPFTDTFMTHVLAFSGKEAEGLRGWDGRSLQRCRRPPPGGFGGHRQEEGIPSCLSFLSRASSTRDRARGGLLTPELTAQEGASASGQARRRQPRASCLCLVFSRPVRQNEK